MSAPGGVNCYLVCGLSYARLASGVGDQTPTCLSEGARPPPHGRKQHTVLYAAIFAQACAL